MNHLIFIRSSIITLAITGLLFAMSPLAYAQVIGDPAASSGPNSSSSGTNFQNASFKQSGASAATSAAGASDLLKQGSSGPLIVVSGAPATQPTATQAKKSPTTLLILLTIVVITALGLAVLLIYKIRKTKAVNQTALVKETTGNIQVSKKDASAIVEPEKPAGYKPKKLKKTKKNKKHHR